MITRTTNDQKLQALVEHALYDLSAGYMGVMLSIGHKLGLYRAMSELGPAKADDIAARASCDARYVTEWLNSQVAGGYLDYDPETRHYELTPEQSLVLADETSPCFMPNAWNVPASMWFDEDKTLHTFRTGSGLSWGDHDARMSCGSAAFFRNTYEANLVQSWLPSLNGVEAKLRAGARVADIGCGHGHSTIIMAKAFPSSRFYGYDGHAESIERAKENARIAGVADRTSFETAAATSYASNGYDLICFFDSLHDMGDPISALEHARSTLVEGGTVMAVEPFAEDRVEDNVNPVGRLYYAASTTICCAHSKSEDVGMALGAQAGHHRLEQVFKAAGFGALRKAMQTPFNLVLEASASRG
jgi:SAM-dependent methyltransferase